MVTYVNSLGPPWNINKLSDTFCTYLKKLIQGNLLSLVFKNVFENNMFVTDISKREL